VSRLHCDSDLATIWRRIAFVLYPVFLHEHLRRIYRYFKYPAHRAG
jgi:hypothetical protein